jgi:hypothetical protein
MLISFGFVLNNYVLHRVKTASVKGDAVKRIVRLQIDAAGFLQAHIIFGLFFSTLREIARGQTAQRYGAMLRDLLG